MNQAPCNCKLYAFLKAARGNWHNALYISCSAPCQYGPIGPCEGYLLTADAEGLPLIIPAKTFRTLTGESIEPPDCRGHLTLQAFRSAYAAYIEWHTESLSDCPLMQLCQDPALPCPRKGCVPPP